MIKTILFIGNSKTSLDIYSILADRIDKSYGDIVKSVLFDGLREKFVSERCDAEQNSPEGILDSGYFTLSNPFIQLVKKIVKITPIYPIINYRAHCAKYAYRDKRAKEIIELLKPDMVVTNSDRTDSISTFILKNTKTIPHVIIPAGLLGDAQSSANNRLKKRKYTINGFFDLKRLIVKRHPEQTIKVGGKTVILFEATEIMAMSRYGILTECPWIEGGFYATDLVCVADKHDSNLIQEYLDRRTLITGLVEDYTIKEQIDSRGMIRQRIIEKYGIENNNLCIIGIPNYADINICSLEIHIQNMCRLVNVLIEKFEKVLISFHPSSNPKDYGIFSERPSVMIMEERLRDVIVAADVYVCDDTSATSRWARLAGCKWVPLLINTWSEELSTKDVEEYFECLESEEKMNEIMKGVSPSVYSGNVDVSDVKDIKKILVDEMFDYKYNK